MVNLFSRVIECKFFSAKYYLIFYDLQWWSSKMRHTKQDTERDTRKTQRVLRGKLKTFIGQSE